MKINPSKHLKSFIAIACTVATNQSHANTIVVEDLIFSTAQVPYQTYCNTAFNGPGILTAMKRSMCPQFYTKENIKNVQLPSGVVRYSAVIPAAIPNSVEKESYAVSNCTSVSRREKNSYSVSFEEGSDITTNTSIKSSQNATLNLKIGVVDFSTGAAREVNTSQESKQSYKKTVTRSVEVDEAVQPYTTLIIEIEQSLSNAYVDFDGDIRVEADVGLGAKYSSLVPNNLVTLKGQIWNASARNLTKSFREIKLDPNTCNVAATQASTGTPTPNASIAAATIKQSESFDDLKAYTKSGAPLQTVPTISQFSSGMGLQTADIMSSVQIRLRSNGATCMVSFNTMGSNTTLAAPSSEWSRWHNIAFAPSKTSLTIESENTCKAGFLAEVRYVK